jgi:hypothetical protein
MTGPGSCTGPARTKLSKRQIETDTRQQLVLVFALIFSRTWTNNTYSTRLHVGIALQTQSMSRSSMIVRVLCTSIGGWVLIACTRHRDEQPCPSCIEADSMSRPSMIRVLCIGGWVLMACTRHREMQQLSSCIEVDSMSRSSMIVRVLCTSIGGWVLIACTRHRDEQQRVCRWLSFMPG